MLVATPHSVRPSVSPTGQKIGRAAFPLFIDMPASYELRQPQPLTEADVFRHTIASRVPPLSDRWTEGMSFAAFLKSTFEQYYAWNKADLTKREKE